MNGTNPTSNGMSMLRELPPEFDESAKEGMRAKARRTKPDHESMGGMSDEWLANELRMLSRYDLWHEAFCTAARDRIMRLSMQLAEARGVIDKFKNSAVKAQQPVSKREVATRLRSWYEAGFLNDNSLSEKKAQLIWAAYELLNADETTAHQTVMVGEYRVDGTVDLCASRLPAGTKLYVRVRRLSQPDPDQLCKCCRHSYAQHVEGPIGDGPCKHCACSSFVPYSPEEPSPVTWTCPSCSMRGRPADAYLCTNCGEKRPENGSDER